MKSAVNKHSLNLFFFSVTFLGKGGGALNAAHKFKLISPCAQMPSIYVRKPVHHMPALGTFSTVHYRTVLCSALGTFSTVHSRTVLCSALGTFSTVHSRTVICSALGTLSTVHSRTVIYSALGTLSTVHYRTVIYSALGTFSTVHSRTVLHSVANACARYEKYAPRCTVM